MERCERDLHSDIGGYFHRYRRSDKRNSGVTHTIDHAVDGERDNIDGTFSNQTRSERLVISFRRTQCKRVSNATGDAYHSDGRLLVVLLQ
jgi:hypothetical protein